MKAAQQRRYKIPAAAVATLGEDQSIAWCPQCRTVKPRSEFYRASPTKQVKLGPGVPFGWCKPCCRIRDRARRLRRTYGITVEQWETLLREQDDRCAICGTAFAGHRGCHVDHCHETGAVRALLCQQCNHGLGNFDDDPERLLLAADYLRKHRLALLRDRVP